jgi:hypothetical protein
MKFKAIFLFFLVLGFRAVQAQTYTLSFAGNQPYQNLVNDTILSDTQWVAKQYKIVLPFPVRISNVVVNTLYVDTDGRIRRLAVSGGTSTFRTLIWGFGNCGLRQKENDTSRISWVIEGTSPNRIAKVQFQNAGFVGDETHTDKVNFQIWMHEDGKRVEIAFGPTQANLMRAMNGAYGPFLGIGSQYIRGTPTAPLLGTIDYGLNGIPQNGHTYRFSRP